MTKEEKEVFDKIWKASGRGNKVYSIKAVPGEKKIVDTLVTKGFLRYLSEKYVKFTKEGIRLGADMNAHIC
jgi:hypothetical protein